MVIWAEKLDSQGDTLIDDKRLTNASRHSFSADVCVDPSGIIHVVWTDDRSSRYEIYYKRSLDGGSSWSTDQSVANDATDEYCYPSIACDSSSVYVVYENDGPNYACFVKGANSGTSGGAPHRIDQGETINGRAR